MGRHLPMPTCKTRSTEDAYSPARALITVLHPPSPGAPEEGDPPRPADHSPSGAAQTTEGGPQPPPGLSLILRSPTPPPTPQLPHARWQEPLAARPPPAAIRPRFPPPLPLAAPPAREPMGPPGEGAAEPAGGRGRAGSAGRLRWPPPPPREGFKPPASCWGESGGGGRGPAGQRWRQRGQAHLPPPQGTYIGEEYLCKGRPEERWGLERQNGLWPQRGSAGLSWRREKQREPTPPHPPLRTAPAVAPRPPAAARLRRCGREAAQGAGTASPSGWTLPPHVRGKPTFPSFARQK